MMEHLASTACGLIRWPICLVLAYKWLQKKNKSATINSIQNEPILCELTIIDLSSGNRVLNATVKRLVERVATAPSKLNITPLVCEE